jgi:hypothetical protein
MESKEMIELAQRERRSELVTIALLLLASPRKVLINLRTGHQV